MWHAARSAATVVMDRLLAARSSFLRNVYDLTGNVSGACSECDETIIISPRPDQLS